MSDAISASVLRSVLRDVKTQREAALIPSDAAASKPLAAAAAPGSLFSETHAQLLATLPPSELALIQSASALVHRNAVKRVVAQPSQRSFFRVESLNRYHARDGESDASFDADASAMISQPFDGTMARGPNYYNVFAHYCSCQSFHEHTVVQCSTAMVRLSIRTRTRLIDRATHTRIQQQQQTHARLVRCMLRTVQAHARSAARRRNWAVPAH